MEEALNRRKLNIHFTENPNAMNSIRNANIFFAFLTLILFNACTESLTGDELVDSTEVNNCREVILNDFSLFAPCDWHITEVHPESNNVGSIYTGITTIYFTDHQVPAINSIVVPEETYYYPVLDGTMIFVEEELDGQPIIAVYFETSELEGQTTRYKFWYNRRFDSAEMRDFLLTIRLN